ncbi:hypothetical protein Tco_0933285 [Tanacetum coccineum]
MDNSKRGHIPMQKRLDLNKKQGASTPKEVKRMQNVPYALVVGSIMYAVRCTRLDVAFAQNITSRFQQNPGELQWTAVKNILKYLRNTKDMFLVYGGNPEAELRVDCYCDAGFKTDKDDTKSQTRYVFHFEWRCIGLEKLQAKYYYNSIELGKIKFLKVHTDDNLADPFTKALLKGKLTQHARSMGLLGGAVDLRLLAANHTELYNIWPSTRRFHIRDFLRSRFQCTYSVVIVEEWGFFRTDSDGTTKPKT